MEEFDCFRDFSFGKSGFLLGTEEGFDFVLAVEDGVGFGGFVLTGTIWLVLSTFFKLGL